ncbi:MAG: serine/threonine protein kinase, partial [Deltaproteobacteria bacterium]|nr:serine/threonine protein kinase [Deltaproteobacteria bacterium]
DSFDDRYCLGRPLGVGCMGEVRRCADQRIGRDVAMKVIKPGHGSRSDLRERFEREARIQGQLDHPSVVPVYDLGVRPDGAAFFTMKRIVGRTLEEIIEGLRAKDDEMVRTYSRHKLLAAFGNVCLTVAFAHQRGVLHRDLKPANIILGPFGEVYVLDWGIAKILPDGETAAFEATVATTASGSSEVDGSAGGASSGTVAGTMMGTPGYMAPEQAQGKVEDLDPRADIYGLGAILYEIITLQPLHRGRTVVEMVALTLAGAKLDSRDLGPEPPPPELTDICAKATALEPADRHSSARELHDAVDQYLAGDRDLQRRREMARDHVLAAHQAMRQAEADPAKLQRLRAEALRQLSAALHLDPNDKTARATMVKMIVESTGDLPPEAEEELERSRHSARARTLKVSAIALLALFLLDPLMAFMGVRSWLALGVMSAILLITALLSFVAARLRRVGGWHFYLFAPSVAILAGSFAVLFGPYVIVPGAFAALSVTVIIAQRANRAERAYLLTAGALVLVAVVGLQRLGWLPPSHDFANGIIAILPWAVSFAPISTELFLLGASLAVMVAPTIVIGGAIDTLVRAERRLFAQTWNLRNLMPAEARSAVEASLEDTQQYAGPEDSSEGGG